MCQQINFERSVIEDQGWLWRQNICLLLLSVLSWCLFHVWREATSLLDRLLAPYDKACLQGWDADSYLCAIVIVVCIHVFVMWLSCDGQLESMGCSRGYSAPGQVPQGWEGEPHSQTTTRWWSSNETMHVYVHPTVTSTTVNCGNITLKLKRKKNLSYCTRQQTSFVCLVPFSSAWERGYSFVTSWC